MSPLAALFDRKRLPCNHERSKSGVRWRCGIVGIAAALMACSGDSPSALDPRGPDAERVAASWWLMFGLAVAVYVVVTAAVIRGLGRPVAVRQQRLILFGGVIMPTLVLAIVGVETVLATRGVFETKGGEPRIVVDGRQFWWDVRYPDDGVVTANEIHIPVGESIVVEVRAGDVIHSLWVPELSPKMDMIPGQPNEMTLEADRPGTYRGQCAEFCGIQHTLMEFVVVAHEPADFERWLDQRRDAPPRPEDALARRGEELFLSEPCAGCHTVAGTDAEGDLGPDLTDVATRSTLGAGAIENTTEALRQWIRDSQEIKPGNLMPPIELTDSELDALVAYMEQLDGR